MDTSTLPHHPSIPSSRPLLKAAALAAAVLYSVVWIVGLVAPTPAITVNTSNNETWDKYADNTTAFVQALLVHGLAGIFLAIVAISLERTASEWTNSHSRWILGSGLVAASISLVQFILESSMVVGILGVSASNAHTYWLTVSVIDGIKMFALAAFVGSIARVSGDATAGRPYLPKWLRITAAIAAVTLVISGIGYTFLIEPLLITAAASLPLLLISVTFAGILAGRHVDHHDK